MNISTIKFLITFVVIVVLCSTASMGQVKKDLLNPMDIFDLELVGSPQISPDGTQIVYVRRFGDVATDRRYSNLWIINVDGTENRPLTSGKYYNGSPRWSPDGTQLIFTSNRNGKTQIFKRWMDTGQTEVLTNLQTSPSRIAWSPDGKWLAYSSFVRTKRKTIAKMPPPPPGSKWGKPAKVYTKLNFRRDGMGDAYSAGYTHIFVMPAEGGTSRQLTEGNFYYGSGGGPVWTADNKFLIVAVNRGDNLELEPRDTELIKIDIVDGSMKALTDRRGPDGAPAVSPDGNYIAYTGFDERYQSYQQRKLYVMNKDGSGSKVILKDFDRGIQNVVWTPDSKGLLFSYSSEGNTKLAHSTLDGKVKKLADNLGNVGFLSVGNGFFTVASNGKLAYTISTPEVFGEIAVGSMTTPGTKIITSINEDVFGHKALGKVEEIWYESSKDGRKIQGWIIKPPYFDPAKKYPLILDIHGGPHMDFGSRFDLMKQFYAANGYVVLYTNPRGSSSYGQEFGNLIHHAYPGDDYYDLISGVDTLIAKGYIDEKNLFVTGASGGGVLSCWIVGHTDRFRAAAPIMPVINWTSWLLTADMPGPAVKHWFPGFPWDYPEDYKKRSPLTYAGKVTTPTMLIVGDNDWRAPYWESEQFYRALKLQKVEAALVIIPNEHHGFFAKISHWISLIQHVIGWFDSHQLYESNS